jgi:hypothetical protein
MRSRLFVLFCASVVFLGLASGAEAAPVTVGSPLTGTFTPVAFGGARLAFNDKLVEPGATAVSPVSGAITAWTIIGSGGPFYLRTLKPMGSGTYLPGAGSNPQTVGSYGKYSFPADVPVAAGEYVAIQASNGTDEIGSAATGSEFQFWITPPTTAATAPEDSAAGAELGFNATILPAPMISSLGTTSGSTAGGTSVVISGANFAEVKSVSFGSTAALGYTVNSEGQITTISPAGSAGAVAVTVTTVAGSASSAFTYVAPPAPAPVVQCKAPNLKGKKLKAAKKALTKAHCKLGAVTKKKGVTTKTGKVVKQAPKAGKTNKSGAKVSVKLG